MWCLVHNEGSLLQARENTNKLFTDSFSPFHHPWSPSGSPTLCLLFWPPFPELGKSIWEVGGKGAGAHGYCQRKGILCPISGMVRIQKFQEMTFGWSHTSCLSLECLLRKGARLGIQPGIWGKPLPLPHISCAPEHMAWSQRAGGTCY